MKHRYCIVFLLSGTYIHCEQSHNNNFQPLPPGAYFSITNSQNFNMEETKRELHVQVEQPPYIVQQKVLQPSNNPPYYNASEQTLRKEPSGGLKAYDSFSYYASSFDYKTPQIFTVKNILYAAGILACGYGILWIKLLHHSHNAKKSNGWGSFQEHIPPTHLSTIAPLVLADGIIEEIKSRYPLPNPSNLMPSLLLFNKDVDQELEELTAFVAFYSWLEKSKLALLFPDQKKLVAKAQTKIQRLHILRDALSEWINTHVTRLIRNQSVPRQEVTINFASDVC